VEREGGVVQRNFGLDLARAFAIVPVVMFHVPWELPLHRFYGVIGVEVFFTLSGFLIVQMIFERFASLRTPTGLGAFLQNRWWRTLPMYFLFLALSWFMSRSDGNPFPVKDLGAFAVFAQNLTQGGIARYGNFYGVSWTLALEEWFYLATALVLFVAPRDKLKWAAVWFAGLALAGLVLRFARFGWFDDGSLDIDDMYRRTVIMRLDAFSYGAAVFLGLAGGLGASVKGLLDHRPRALFAAGGGIVLASIAAGLLDMDVVAKVLRFTALPLGFGLMLPLMLRLKPPLAALERVAYFLSTRTYAIYLSHIPVMSLFYALGLKFSLAGLPVYLAMVLLASDALYRWFERPAMRMRPVQAKT
jgi:peptidoglycan/LPS O-acetylase OafA/YrhL